MTGTLQLADRTINEVAAALRAGEFEALPGGRFRVGGHELGPDDVLVERAAKEGWAVASDEGVTVALDTALDPDMRARLLVDAPGNAAAAGQQRANDAREVELDRGERDRIRQMPRRHGVGDHCHARGVVEGRHQAAEETRGIHVPGLDVAGQLRSD